MSDTTFATPEEAAVADFPAEFVRVESVHMKKRLALMRLVLGADALGVTSTSEDVRR